MFIPIRALAAYVYSVVATLAPGIFPAGFHGIGGMVSIYFEAAAVITVLVLLGQVLKLRARRVRDGGDDEEVAIELVCARRPRGQSGANPK